MGNLVSLLTQCGRGDEVILGDQAHTFLYEQGGMAALGGIHPRVVRNQPDGTLDLDEVAAAIRDPGNDVHSPRTRLITVENTHNRCGGVPLTVAYMHDLGRAGAAHGLRVHVDGARIFNAAVALGVDVKELVADADSVTFCLSKGLAAPVGSVVCGEQGVHRRGAAGAQDGRRRDAAGRRARGRGHRRAGADGRPAGRGSRQRAGAGRRTGRAARHRGRAGASAHQHRVLPDRRGPTWMRPPWWPAWTPRGCG